LAVARSSVVLRRRPQRLRWVVDLHCRLLLVRVSDDLVSLMDALGHDWFSVVGHDTGMVILASHAGLQPRSPQVA
jgi:hypothetical protein